MTDWPRHCSKVVKYNACARKLAAVSSLSKSQFVKLVVLFNAFIVYLRTKYTLDFAEMQY